MMENHALRRRQVLVSLIQKRLKENPATDSVVLPRAELESDFDKLERTLEKIKTDMTPDFEFSFIRHREISSAGDINMEHPIFSVQGVKVIVDDPGHFARYLNEIEEEIKTKERQTYDFILNDEGGLSLVGGQEVYKIKKGSFRHEIVRYLAKKEGVVSAKVLASKVGMAAEDVRKTIGKINSIVSKRLGESSKVLIKNVRHEGYTAPTLKLSNSEQGNIVLDKQIV